MVFYKTNMIPLILLILYTRKENIHLSSPLRARITLHKKSFCIFIFVHLKKKEAHRSQRVFKDTFFLNRPLSPVSMIMKPVRLHPWNLSEEEAILLQRHLAKQVIQEDPSQPIQYVAGVDVAYDSEEGNHFAAAVILDAHSLEIVEAALAKVKVSFPYRPGLFSFRELPPIIDALAKLQKKPDLIVCDGQGIAHPRRLGLASHLGILFDIPTIGCGKTRLIGEADIPGEKRGDRTPLMDQGEIIGSVLRTQDQIKPVYVSVGHRITLQTACHWILHLAPRYRLPETTRQADQLVRRAIAMKNEKKP